MKNRRQKLGAQGENLAAARLSQMGYEIIKTNWRCKFGELDMVAWHEKCLTFIEVRTRQGNRSGTPEESVNARKQLRLQTLVEAFLQAEGEALGLGETLPPCRIDVVAIEYRFDGQLTRLEVIQNAVEG